MAEKKWLSVWIKIGQGHSWPYFRKVWNLSFQVICLQKLVSCCSRSLFASFKTTILPMVHLKVKVANANVIVKSITINWTFYNFWPLSSLIMWPLLRKAQLLDQPLRSPAFGGPNSWGHLDSLTQVSGLVQNRFDQVFITTCLICLSQNHN